MNAIRKRINKIVRIAEPGDSVSRAFDLFIFALIILNVAAIIIETTSLGAGSLKNFFYWFEVISVAIFTVEYILRVWSSVEDPMYAQALGGRLRFALTPLMLVDLLAILPFYLPFVLALDLRVLRILRLIRIFRLFRLARYLENMKIMVDVFKNKKEEILITLSVGFMLLLIASTLMYHIEHDAQPEVFSSIPSAMWWGVATLTTVGYGDTYPVTSLGRMLGSLIAILGIGMFALPAGILGSGFVEEMGKKKKTVINCPHCGKKIHK